MKNYTKGALDWEAKSLFEKWLQTSPPKNGTAKYDGWCLVWPEGKDCPVLQVTFQFRGENGFNYKGIAGNVPNVGKKCSAR